MDAAGSIDRFIKVRRRFLFPVTASTMDAAGLTGYIHRYSFELELALNWNSLESVHGNSFIIQKKPERSLNLNRKKENKPVLLNSLFNIQLEKEQ